MAASPVAFECTLDRIVTIGSGVGAGNVVFGRIVAMHVADSVLTADGIISLVGCLMGNPFILAVYIGQPGGKAIDLASFIASSVTSPGERPCAFADTVTMRLPSIC